MKQGQLPSKDWHYTHCPAYKEEFDNCPERLRLFSHCKECPVKNRPKIDPKQIPTTKKCGNYDHTEPQCQKCEAKGKRGNKSCKLLTVRSKEERKRQRRIKKLKGRRITGLSRRRKIPQYKKPKLVTFSNLPDGDDIHE